MVSDLPFTRLQNNQLSISKVWHETSNFKLYIIIVYHKSYHIIFMAKDK